MPRSIEHFNAIKKEKLSAQFYFQSLLKEAEARGLLSREEIESIQYECFVLLSQKIDYYNSDGSSSVSKDVAQEIMTSNLFTIGLALKQYPSPDNAVTELKSKKISEIYQEGLGQIKRLLDEVKLIHRKLLSQLVESPNIFYRSTLEGGINGFFKLYNPEFAAHEIHITADYPSFNPIARLAGIEFIYHYVKSLYFENLFCSFFDAKSVHYLLSGYEKNYEELVINLYEPVLMTALGAALINKNPFYLNLFQQDIGYLENLFSEMTKTEILRKLQEAYTVLAYRFDFPEEMEQYLDESLVILSGKIDFAVKNQQIQKVFCSPVYLEQQTEVLFDGGTKMADELYRKLLDEIRDSESVQEKMFLIQGKVTSFDDLNDLLIDSQLSENDLIEILKGLTLPEIAALAKIHSSFSETDDLEYSENEERLRGALDAFIAGFGKEEQELLARISEAIKLF